MAVAAGAVFLLCPAGRGQTTAATTPAAAAGPPATTATTGGGGARALPPAPATAPRAPNLSPGSWEVYPSPTNRELVAADFVNEDDGWAVGEGVILHFVNGMWTVYEENLDRSYRDVDMVSANDGWITGLDWVTEKEKIWRWNGSRWQEFQVLTGAIRCIDMLDANHGWMAGSGYFLRFNGSSWEYGGGAPDIMYDIEMESDAAGRAAGYHYVMRRSAGSWYLEASDNDWDLAGITMVNASEGWATGNYLPTNKALLLKYDGAWKENRVFSSAVFLAKVCIYGSDFGWAVGWRNPGPTFGGFMIYYDGENWHEQPPTTDSALLEVCVIDRENAWAFGGDGVILEYKPNVAVRSTSLGKIKASYR